MVKTYFVDIDDTICTVPVVNGHKSYHRAEPDRANITYINALYEEGHTIIYWTARAAKRHYDEKPRDVEGLTKLTKKQLKGWGCKYHEVRLDKPYYDTLIDDRTMRLVPLDSPTIDN